MESYSNKRTSVNESIALPHLDPVTWKIGDEFSKSPKPIEPGYRLTFNCNQPYQIMNGIGEIIDGEANKDVDLGMYYSQESTQNLNLQFRTRNNSSTEMTIYFTPIKIQTKRR
jgi:GH24 family phage-related lysozyme (muramidase)